MVTLVKSDIKAIRQHKTFSADKTLSGYSKTFKDLIWGRPQANDDAVATKGVVRPVIENPHLSIVVGQDVKHQRLSFMDRSHRNFGIHNHDVIVPTSFLQLEEQLIIHMDGKDYAFVYGGVMESKRVDHGMFYAHTPEEIFVSAKEGDRFSMTSQSFGMRVFRFIKRSPDLSAGEFNSLQTLKEAVSYMPGLTARIQENQLYIASEEGNSDLYFMDCDDTPFTNEIGLHHVKVENYGAACYATAWRLAELINDTIPQLETQLIQGVFGCELSITSLDRVTPISFSFSSKESRLPFAG